MKSMILRSSRTLNRSRTSIQPPATSIRIVLRPETARRIAGLRSCAPRLCVERLLPDPVPLERARHLHRVIDRSTHRYVDPGTALEEQLGVVGIWGDADPHRVRVLVG